MVLKISHDMKQGHVSILLIFANVAIELVQNSWSLRALKKPKRLVCLFCLTSVLCDWHDLSVCRMSLYRGKVF